MAAGLIHEKIWMDKSKYDDAERQHFEGLAKMDTVLASVHSEEVVNRISSLETALQDLRKLVIGIQSEVKTLAERIPAASAPAPAVCPLPAKAPKAPAVPAPTEDSDDGVDLFASDSDGEDDDAAAKIREERLANYAAKKSTKPVLIAKSNIILDVKPWDDETDMKVLEEKVRKIACDGLLWGASKLVTLAYGIQKLQISCVVEDDKVSIDWLQEEIEKNEDYVQSVDIAAFNKV